LLPAGVTFQSESLRDFLEVLRDNFQRNEPLLALIDNLAGGNMRMALTFVSNFIGSGHVNTRKILETYKASGYYNIPVHEFMRALL
jgi:Na+-transporting NADH:ubiquinone oxidoreductase subunit NqrD